MRSGVWGSAQLLQNELQVISLSVIALIYTGMVTWCLCEFMMCLDVLRLLLDR